MKINIKEIIGWYGMLAILGAYALNSFGILSAQDIWYQLLNLTGGIGIAYISFTKKVYQSVALNFIWIMIALYAIIKIIQ